MRTEQSSDPRVHTAHIREMLEGTIDHIRQDVGRVDDPKAKALFETTAEVLIGLRSAYQHYDEASESAWR